MAAGGSGEFQFCAAQVGFRISGFGFSHLCAISHATPIVTTAPISVYHGQKISVPTVLIQRFLVESSLGKSWIPVITAREINMPTMTGALRPFLQNTARANPPSNAPLVSPRNEKAAFST